MFIKIEGEVLEVYRVYEGGYLPMVETDGGDFHLAEDHDAAGNAAKEYWSDMAAYDPEEFACIVGKETLISWAMGQLAGPGTAKVRSLSQWLDVVADHPEEEFAGYDHNERSVDRCGTLANDLGFMPTLAYRHN